MYLYLPFSNTFLHLQSFLDSAIVFNKDGVVNIVSLYMCFFVLVLLFVALVVIVN